MKVGDRVGADGDGDAECVPGEREAVVSQRVCGFGRGSICGGRQAERETERCSRELGQIEFSLVTRIEHEIQPRLGRVLTAGPCGGKIAEHADRGGEGDGEVFETQGGGAVWRSRRLRFLGGRAASELEAQAEVPGAEASVLDAVKADVGVTAVRAEGHCCEEVAAALRSEKLRIGEIVAVAQEAHVERGGLLRRAPVGEDAAALVPELASVGAAEREGRFQPGGADKGRFGFQVSLDHFARGFEFLEERDQVRRAGERQALLADVGFVDAPRESVAAGKLERIQCGG